MKAIIFFIGALLLMLAPVVETYARPEKEQSASWYAPPPAPVDNVVAILPAQMVAWRAETLALFAQSVAWASTGTATEQKRALYAASGKPSYQDNLYRTA